MVKNLNNRKAIDKAGVFLSTACLIHCLMLPVILTTFPFLAFLSFMQAPWAEALMIVFAIVNSIAAVTLNFKKHRKMIVPAMFASGSLLLLLHFIAHSFVHSNPYVIAIGAGLIGLGHIINHMFCATCPKCKEEDLSKNE